MCARTVVGRGMRIRRTRSGVARGSYKRIHHPCGTITSSWDSLCVLLLMVKAYYHMSRCGEDGLYTMGTVHAARKGREWMVLGR